MPIQQSHLENYRKLISLVENSLKNTSKSFDVLQKEQQYHEDIAQAASAAKAAREQAVNKETAASVDVTKKAIAN